MVETALHKLPDPAIEPISKLRASLRPSTTSLDPEGASSMLTWGVGLAGLALCALAFVILRAC